MQESADCSWVYAGGIEQENEFMETALLSSRLDEDDFDWEAAVREIDSACAATIASTSINAAVSPNLPSTVSGGSCPRPAAPLCRGRQSTLDTFVGTNAKQKNNNICSNESGHQELEGRSVRNNPFRHGDGTPAVRIDLEAANTWIYPVNVPLRDYQFTIAKKALFSNTLVALPTGLGKTLIAAVVMYNYFRWFPEGKIVFAAPSRPLVMQQIEACHNIVGIPQEWTIDMTGQMSPPKRSSFWKAKRVFFLTPQVFEKDIQSGICLVRQLVCLVFDEAHRAMGNYAYCVAVRELMALSMNLRILALTATPGSKHQTIQQVIDNLCISNLEYRNESDHDVNSYMHSRKLDVIVVPMGKDAVEINNILLQAVQPFIARLSDIGALPHRDFSTLSPSELLNLRDKFRQAPPPTLPQSKYRDIEAYFCVLITFYHIRKLLSSHGIKPAYEMLEDKFNRGPFSNFLSKTEAFWKAKNLMQQSLSHGAPTPKVVKMLEILVDHFTKKDPNNSRVIIFSNFRGSVRDIMSNLSSLGNMVKAAEFIGQSSGKTIKGQTQKVQQAVLEKFRSGAYNVIVATSIGEEGLDIMEVDLVICFDANVSPLRMIQRMGRTGRKNDGRVVVLACEGTEQKAYLKKLASSKAIRKHMHNGGIKSFNFHPSPRMVPHICQPQVQYLEMSIEQFVHRGKKVKCATMNGSPFLSNISNDEQHLLAKYFPRTEDETCKLSLIAFPSFQALPSQISRVRHSFRTTLMFIDAMQALQGLSFSKVNNEMIEVETSSRPSNELSACLDDIGLGSALVRTSSQIGGAPFQVLPRQSLVDKTDFCMHHHDIPKMKPHRFLFSNDSVTLCSSGIVFISYVPVIKHRGCKDCKVTSTVHGNLFPEVLKPNATCTEISPNFSGIPVKQVQNVKLKDFSWLIQEVEVEQENKKHSFQAPGFEPNHQDSNISTAKISCIMEDASTEINVERSINAAANILLSPRLTHFIAEGVVPQSPILNIKPLSPSDENRLFSACSWEEANLVSQSVVVLDTPNEHKSLGHCSTPPNLMKISDIPSKETNYEKILATVNCSTIESINEKNILYSAKEVFRTPNTMNQSLSEDWKCSSGEASNSLINAPKFKRLCKQRDLDRNLPVKTLEKRFNLVEATCGSIKNTHRNKIKYNNGETKKSIKQGDAFIEEEAEVSDDASVSEDEMDDEMHDRYEDSFIDDRINPTEGSTEAENCGVDMTAFYRRSLLTQSPTIFQANYQPISSQSLSSGTAVSSPERQPTLIITPQHSMQSLNQLDCQNSVISNSIPGKASQPGRCSDKLKGRKRKLFSQPSDTMPEENSQLLPETQPACAETALEHHKNAPKSDTFIFWDNDDDDFYQGLDLDEVEAQATKLIRSRSQAQPAPIDEGTSTRINFS